MTLRMASAVQPNLPARSQLNAHGLSRTSLRSSSGSILRCLRSNGLSFRHPVSRCFFSHVSMACPLIPKASSVSWRLWLSLYLRALAECRIVAHALFSRFPHVFSSCLTILVKPCVNDFLELTRIHRLVPVIQAFPLQRADKPLHERLVLRSFGTHPVLRHPLRDARYSSASRMFSPLLSLTKTVLGLNLSRVFFMAALAFRLDGRDATWISASLSLRDRSKSP